MILDRPPTGPALSAKKLVDENGDFEIPYFPDLNCLFVHIPKNAGRSIETALLKESGSPDSGRRSLVNRAATLLSRSTAPSFAKTHLIGTLDVTLAAQHLTFVEMEMLGLLPDTTNYMSFCVVRNPYDRALSSVMHFSEARWVSSEDEDERRMGFEQGLKAWLEMPLPDHNIRAHHRSQVDFIRNRHGEIAIDHLLRFENLEDDFSNLLTRIGAENRMVRKIGDSGRSRMYRDFYTPDARRLIDSAFKQDIEMLGYSF